ncbi:rhombosortase [Reinekea sp.]|jgi:rhomboid family GlyGly-CTERM serine protease|uniref:rhombosortase n=1 Tax=Reinekea sp. TaxID=1970455 RepID=UPI002A819941|nr:rhombosortase [Reinekea sp.]
MIKLRLKFLEIARYLTVRPSLRGLLWLALATLLCTQPLVADWLQYDAAQTRAGQIWRPFTAWLVQLNLRHWLLNQWGLVVMALLVPPRWSVSDRLGLLTVWVVASLMLVWSDYGLYVGLSGLLYGWLVVVAARSPYYSSRVRLIFIAALTVKVLAENGWLPLPSSSWVGDFIDADIAYRSHLWGLLAGLTFSALRWLVPARS